MRGDAPRDVSGCGLGGYLVMVERFVILERLGASRLGLDRDGMELFLDLDGTGLGR